MLVVGLCLPVFKNNCLSLLILIEVFLAFKHCNAATCSQDQEVFGAVGESVTLQCRDLGTDNIVIWKHLSTSILYHDIDSSDGVQYLESDFPKSKYEYSESDYSLTVNNLDKDDQHCFSCQTSPSAVQVLILVTLVVTPTEPSLTVFPTFQESIAKSVTCKVSSVKPGKGSIKFTIRVEPDFTVQSDDSDLSETVIDSDLGTVSVTYTTQITLQRKHNGRNAECEIEWRGESFTSSPRQADVTFDPSDVSMSGAPTGLVTENTEVTVVCTTPEGNPVPMVNWYRDGQSVPVDTDLESVTNTQTNGPQYNGKVRVSTLKIQTDKSLNGKQYRCEVEGTIQEESFVLQVAYVEPPVTLEGSPASNQPVNEGVTVQFTCSVGANPEPIYSMWTSDGGTTTKWSDMSGDSISLILEKTHNRVAVFCRADGSLEEYPLDSTQKTYTVLFAATAISMDQSPSGSVTENTDVTFTCVTDEAEPTAEVVWTVGGSERASGISNTEVDDGQYNAKKRRSELTVRVDRELNGKTVECHVKDKSEVRDTETLDVRFPPDVSVDGYSDPIVEDTVLALTCRIEAGNPSQTTSQFWEFEPRYPGSVSQALPAQKENRELRIEDTKYSDAGRYTCTAGNGVGPDTDDQEVVVHFQPYAVSIDTVFYAAVGQSVTLNITVRAFPQLTDSSFTWRKDSGSQITNGVTGNKLENDEYYSQLVIDNVASDDYTTFAVSVDNGIIGAVDFKLELEQRGPPQAAQNVTVLALSAQQVMVGWIVGLSGGSKLTFQVLYSTIGASEKQFVDVNVPDPIFRSQENYTVSGLSPTTDYVVVVRSMNKYQGGSETDSISLTITTREQPYINEDDLKVELQNSVALLSWQYEVEDPDVTTLVIEQCKNDGNCKEHFVTNNTEKSLEVPRSDGEIFHMVIYQDGLEALNQRFAVITTTITPEPGTPPVTIIAIAVSVSVVILIVLIVVVVLLRRRKMKGPQENKPLNISDEMLDHPGVDNMAPYAAVDVTKKKNKKDKDKLTSGNSGAEGSAEYAPVDMTKKKNKKQKQENGAEAAAEYAPVDMTKKKNKKQKQENADNMYAEVDRTNKKKKKGKKETKNEDMMYANVPNPVEAEGMVYENVSRNVEQPPEQPEDTGRYVTEEGLTYAAVAFNQPPAARPPVGEKPVIIGDENRVIYDSVDFAKTAARMEGGQ